MGGFLLTVPILSQASADSQKVSISKVNDEVILQVQEKGDFYKFYKNNELVYEGTSNSFSEPMDYELQKYKVGVYKDNELEKVLSVKVTNSEKLNKQNNLNKNMRLAEEKSKEDTIKETIKSTRLETIVETNSITLKWPKLPDNDKIYEIYKDDKKIAETRKQSYTDNDVKPNQEYRYDLKVKNELSASAKKKLKDEAALKNVTLTKEDYMYEGIISTIVATPTNNEDSLTTDEVMDPLTKAEESTGIGTRAVPNSQEFTFNYRTFIPYVSVKNLNPFSGYSYLKGDNRSSFLAYTDKFRTESSVYALFNNPPALTLWRTVNPTFVCKEAACTTKPKEAGTANPNGMKINKYKVEKNNLRWAVDHSIGIPLGAEYPNIDYYYLAVLTPKSFSVSGDHDKAPNHEFWMNYPAGSKKIYSYSVSSKIDFWKLAGGSKATWSFDM